MSLGSHYTIDPSVAHYLTVPYEICIVSSVPSYKHSGANELFVVGLDTRLRPQGLWMMQRSFLTVDGTTHTTTPFTNLTIFDQKDVRGSERSRNRSVEHVALHRWAHARHNIDSIRLPVLFLYLDTAASELRQVLL